MKAILAALLLPVAQPIAAPLDTACVAEIRSVLLSAMTSGPYQRETRQQLPNGELNIVDTRAIPGEAMHQMTFTRNGDIAVQIVIGDKGWHMFNGAWSELDSRVRESLMSSAAGGYVAASIEGMKDAACSGPVNHNGRAVLSYRFAVENEYGNRTEVVLIADPATKLPIEQTSMPQLDGPVAILTDTFTYDPSITIEPPEF